jgi:hypothetical protein
MHSDAKSLLARAAVPTAMIAALLGPAAPAVAAASGVVVSQVQPVNSATTSQMWIERVAPVNLTAAPTWRVNADMRLTAPSGHSVKLTSVATSFPGTSLTSSTHFLNKTIAANAAYFLIVPESRSFAFPIASSIRFTLSFDGYDPITVDRTLKEYVNKTPSGGYRFPASRVSNGYWFNLIGHENASGHNTHHRGAQNQRFAYDLVVQKWDSAKSKYTELKPGTSGTTNSDYWSFGAPIYSMADGYIEKCRRDQVENVPGTPDDTPEVEGNHLYVRHATGEVVLYAHFKAGSVSTTLCPSAAADNLNIFVKQGQFLGYSGNTGNSYSPHLHLHLAHIKGFGTYDVPAQGLPLRFNHATTRTGTNYAPGATPGFYALSNSTEGALPDWNLISPNNCGWLRLTSGSSEVARHGVNLNCYQEEFNDIKLAGYRPVWRQQVQYGTATHYVSSIWRSNSPYGVVWAAKHALDSATYQSQFDSYKTAGYRLTHVDSYLQSGGVRYSGIWTKTSGVAWTAYHGVSAATHSSKFNTLTGQGYVPSQISVVSLNGTRYYTALYEKTSPGSFVAMQTIAESSYQTTFNQQNSAGRHPAYIDVYRDGSTNRFSVIFKQNPTTAWTSTFNATGAQYQTAYNSNISAGRLTRAVSAYESSGLKYAAFWQA